MIRLGNYWLSFGGHNHITIGLPPTADTARDTVTPIEDRRTDVTEEELVNVLGLVTEIFAKDRMNTVWIKVVQE